MYGPILENKHNIVLNMLRTHYYVTEVYNNLLR